MNHSSKLAVLILATSGLTIAAAGQARASDTAFYVSAIEQDYHDAVATCDDLVEQGRDNWRIAAAEDLYGCMNGQVSTWMQNCVPTSIAPPSGIWVDQSYVSGVSGFSAQYHGARMDIYGGPPSQVLVAMQASTVENPFICISDEPSITWQTLASYDGNYVPNGTAPAGQTTWTTAFQNGSCSMTPDVPLAGLAHFNDNSGGCRTSLEEPLTDTPIADEEWVYELRMRINSAHQGGNVAYLVVGVRDEGTSNDRAALLGFFNNSLRLVSNSTTTSGSIEIAQLNLGDGLMHDYRVEKLSDGAGSFEIHVFIDDVLYLTVPYTDLPTNTGYGFGYFTSTPNSSDVHLDLLSLSVAQ